MLMGLYGSEYWIFTLPRRVGAKKAAELVQACLPVSPASAEACGPIDRADPGDTAGFRQQVAVLAGELARSPDYQSQLTVKARRLAELASTGLLDRCRQAELEAMRQNFSGPGEPYPRLRRAFVCKQKPTQTPVHLALHRSATSDTVQPGDNVRATGKWGRPPMVANDEPAAAVLPRS